MELTFTCPNCGLHLAGEASTAGQQMNCPNCSKAIIIPALAGRASLVEPANVDTRKRGLAVASFILGLVSIIFFVFCLGFFMGIPAVILGHMARHWARKKPKEFAGEGMAMAGIIMGYVSVCGILFVLGAVGLAQSHSNQNAPVNASKNNLKEIGLAFRIWADDHHGQYPFNVSQTNGGALELCQRDTNGFEMNPVPVFQIMADALESTMILVSPNDPVKKPAADYATLTVSNITYRLRTGTEVNATNPQAILAVDPVNGLVLDCDGEVRTDLHYKEAAVAGK